MQLALQVSGKAVAAVQPLPTDGGCALRYALHFTVGGKLARLGRRPLTA